MGREFGHSSAHLFGGPMPDDGRLQALTHALRICNDVLRIPT